MKYIARKQDVKPFIYWEGFTGVDNALVLDEANIPATVYGVYPFFVNEVTKQLENYTPQQMADFQAEYNTAQVQKNYQSQTEAFTTATFDFNHLAFPMHLAARTYYEKVIERAPGNYKVMSSTVQYDLQQGDNANFLQAYYIKLKEIVTPV